MNTASSRLPMAAGARAFGALIAYAVTLQLHIWRVL